MNKNYIIRSTAVTMGLLLAMGTISPVLAENDDTSSQQTEQSQGNPPEKPDGEQSEGNPPEKPDGEQSEGNPPEKPDGEQPSGTPPEMPDGEQPDGNPPEMSEGGAPQGGGADTQNYDYSGELSGTLSADGETKDSIDETIESTEKDVNTVLAENGGTVNIENGTLKKSGDDEDGDSCNFYGVNSGVLSVGDNSLVKISNSKIETDSSGSNALFATDNGKVYIYDSVIETSKDNSRGLDATYGGTVIGQNLEVSTSGDHCATLATDRGGGNISVSDSTLVSAGSGSPLLYSTGVIEVDHVQGESSGSQIAGMEGMNTIRIKNSTLTSTITDKTASDPVADGIIIYQSMSGDADTSSSEKAYFSAEGSTLKSAITSGAMFYVTNTTADIVLKDTTLDFDSSNVNLLLAQGNDSNGWGTAGKNGGHVTMTCYNETIQGKISVDSISKANLYLLEDSTWTGSFERTQNTSSDEETEDNAIVNVASGSKWIVTGDSEVSSLHAEEGSSIVDEDGKTVSIVCNGETVVSGDSAYTITVTDTYDTTLGTDMSDQDSMNLSIDRTDFENTFTLSAEDTTEATVESSTNFKATDMLYIVIPVAVVGALIVVKKKKEKH